MRILGINCSKNASKETVYTLHLATNFEPYYSDKHYERTCIGERVESIYVGTYDCSDLDVGMEVEIYYDRAKTSSKGTYQTVKKIEII